MKPFFWPWIRTQFDIPFLFFFSTCFCVCEWDVWGMGDRAIVGLVGMLLFSMINWFHIY